MKGKLEKEVQCLTDKVKDISVDHEYLSEKVDTLRYSLISLQDSVTAIKKALELANSRGITEKSGSELDGDHINETIKIMGTNE